MMGNRFIVVAALVTVGCAESPREAPPAESAQPASQASSAATGGAATPTGPDACEDLTEARLRAALALPDTVELTQSGRRGPTSSSCEYTWSDPAADAEPSRREALEEVARALREGRGTEAAQLARGVGPATARYIETPPDTSPEAARERFEVMMQRLNEGVTRELNLGPSGPSTLTLQSSTESVTGVGDAAHWSADLRQLFVLSGPRFFQVTVRVRPEPTADLELAKAIASAIVAADRGAGTTAPPGAPSAPSTPSAVEARMP